MPPSPMPPRFFEGKNEKQAPTPIVPARLPCHSEPIACAASSSTLMPRGSHRARIAGMSAHWPNRCTGTTAFVFAVMQAASLTGSRL